LKLKQYVRYGMDFTCKWSGLCIILMGLSFFLRIVYYFGLVNLEDIGGGEVFGCLILPLIVCGTFIILFRALKWNAPGIYAILGAFLCILLLIWNFSSGDGLRIILSVPAYIASAIILLATAGGYIPTKLPAALLLAVIFLCRSCFYSFDDSGLVSLVLEISVLSMIASLVVLSLCFTPHISAKEHK